MEHPQYNPDTLLDTVRLMLGLKNDAALARRLRVAASSISKIRNRRQVVSAEMIVCLHEETRLSIRDLRWLCGDFRPHTGASSVAQPPDDARAERLLAEALARKCGLPAALLFPVATGQASDS